MANVNVVDLLFFLNIAWITTHELDAIAQHEWRFFLPAKWFSDVTAYRVFTLVHIPLFAIILASAGSRPFQIGFDLLLIFHAGLHWFLRNHPSIEFKNWFSQLIIWGAAAFGALHLILIVINPPT